MVQQEFNLASIDCRGGEGGAPEHVAFTDVNPYQQIVEVFSSSPSWYFGI